MGIDGKHACHHSEGFAKEPRGTARIVRNLLANLRFDDSHDGTDQRPRAVVFAAVPASVAHVFDLGFGQVRQFVLFRLGPEPQLVDVVEDLAKVVTAGDLVSDLVSDLAEDLADLVFDRVRPAGFLFEGFQVREQLVVDEVPQVVTGCRFVVVNLPVRTFGSRPLIPAIGLVENPGVLPALKFRLGGFVLFQPLEVFQKEKSGSLFGVVEFRGTAGFLPENVVDIPERLLEHGWRSIQSLLLGLQRWAAS